jgi:hypothetical protein
MPEDLYISMIDSEDGGPVKGENEVSGGAVWN